VKEEVVWGKYGKGREYVHMPLVEVCFLSPHSSWPSVLEGVIRKYG
jgi:hypothetical protein